MLNKRANAHIVSFKEANEDVDITIQKLQEIYSKFNPVKGDIIINADESGYRSEGLYFYDGKR